MMSCGGADDELGGADDELGGADDELRYRTMKSLSVLTVSRQE
jgi:hypothetical protein